MTIPDGNWLFEARQCADREATKRIPMTQFVVLCVTDSPRYFHELHAAIATASPHAHIERRPNCGTVHVPPEEAPWLVLVHSHLAVGSVIGDDPHLAERFPYAKLVMSYEGGGQDVAFAAKRLGVTSVVRSDNLLTHLPALVVTTELDRASAQRALETQLLAEAVEREFGADARRELGLRTTPPSIPAHKLMSLLQWEEIALRETLAATRGNQSVAAETLRISRSTLRRKLAQHGVPSSPLASGSGTWRVPASTPKESDEVEQNEPAFDLTGPK